MIESLIEAAQNHLLLIQILAFLVAFLESLAIVGTIIPGSVTMLPFGLMLGAGKLPLWSTLLIIIIGAFIGDYVSYLAGIYYKDSIADWQWFKKRPHWLTNGKDFIENHGGKSIILGRFFGPLRSSVPLLAGALHMGQRPFILAAIPSVTMWAIIYLTPGYIISAWGTHLGMAHWTALICIITLIILFFASRFCQNMIKFFVQNKYIHIPDHLISLCWITLILLAVYALLASGVALGYADQINHSAHQWIDSWRSSSLEKWATAFSISADKKTLFVMSIGGGLTLLINKHYRMLILLILPILMQVCVVDISKAITACQRPISHIVDHLHSFSFPSGHISAASVLSFAIIRVALANQRQSLRLAATIFLSLWCVLVMLSQLILQVHWIFDLIGALVVFGLCACTLTVICESTQPIKDKLSQRSLLTLLVIALAAQSIMINLKYNSNRYQIKDTSCQSQS